MSNSNKGKRRYGSPVVNASESPACKECMERAMDKCGDKPHDQAIAIAISECKDKCKEQPK